MVAQLLQKEHSRSSSGALALTTACVVAVGSQLAEAGVASPPRAVAPQPLASRNSPTSEARKTSQTDPALPSDSRGVPKARKSSSGIKETGAGGTEKAGASASAPGSSADRSKRRKVASGSSSASSGEGAASSLSEEVASCRMRIQAKRLSSRGTVDVEPGGGEVAANQECSGVSWASRRRPHGADGGSSYSAYVGRSVWKCFGSAGHFKGHIQRFAVYTPALNCLHPKRLTMLVASSHRHFLVPRYAGVQRTSPLLPAASHLATLSLSACTNSNPVSFPQPLCYPQPRFPQPCYPIASGTSSLSPSPPSPRLLPSSLTWPPIASASVTLSPFPLWTTLCVRR